MSNINSLQNNNLENLEQIKERVNRLIEDFDKYIQQNSEVKTKELEK